MSLSRIRDVIVRERLPRQLALAVLQTYAEARFWGAGPRVLVNSFPKAGTHLVTAELTKLEGIHNSYVHLQPRDFNRLAPDRQRLLDFEPDVDALARRLRKVGKGQVVTAHFAYIKEFCELLDELNYRTIFVVRDPRDVLISDLNYVKTLPRHFLHRTLMEKFSTDAERLEAMIRGIDRPPYVRPLAQRWQRYLNWMEAPSVLTVRFEDLVGTAGGGDDAAKRASMGRIAAHIGREDGSIPEQEVLRQQKWTPTLRSGRTNRWREVLTPSQIALFETEMSGVMTALGYWPSTAATRPMHA
jgi:hypothetical protein